MAQKPSLPAELRPCHERSRFPETDFFYYTFAIFLVRNVMAK